ncbi:AraC family transcriptional regulator [Sphingobium subterraneum]|uniref:AraC family transcriptional regulator n=1 Tax=Sphingobium subterraneum TaxID=627688 RepID=A0A841J3E9_9SPHN|nr:response regulator transcription factor [Sphingobium subterraneum]MBB6125337.1 AraC family transcriptional regulator [Sphingobium subterraneum]
MRARENIVAQMAVPGVTVQLMDYRWSAGEQITYSERDFVVLYRPYNTQVTVAARTDARLLDFGQLMFFPADLSIKTAAANVNELVRSIRCRFDPEWFGKVWNTLFERWDDEKLEKCFDMRNVRIEQAVRRLGVEITNPGFASPLMIESISNVIAIEIARYFRDSDNDMRVRTRAGKLSEADISRICEYVSGVENKCPNVQEIAEHCDISPAHLRRSFKNTTGQTVYKYVEDIRLKKAQHLLADSDLALKEISFRLGFANSSTFSSTFKRISGESPSEYRYRHRH